MKDEQFKQIMNKLAEIESRLFCLENPGTLTIRMNEQGNVQAEPCYHPESYFDTSGWHCPNCGAYTPYTASGYPDYPSSDLTVDQCNNLQ